MSRNRVLILILVVAAVLTGAAGFMAARIETEYLKDRPFFYDSVSYSFINAGLYARIPMEGRWTVAAREWKENLRHPLRTIPLILFAPKALAHPLGHMLTALPALFIFLWLSGWTFYKRSGSLLYGLSGIFFLASLPILYDPTMGLGAYWLDLVAAFYLGAGVLCLLNSDEARDLRWLAGFAFFAAVAVLGRYAAAIYVLITCGPLLVFFLLRSCMKEARKIRFILVRMGSMAAILLPLTGNFLLTHFKDNFVFYTHLDIPDRGAALDSLLKTLHFLNGFLSGNLVVIAIVFLVTMGLNRGIQKRQFSEAAVTLWLAVSVVLFMGIAFGLRGPLRHTVLYALPGLLIAAWSPVSLTPAGFNRKILSGFSVVLIGASLFSGFKSVTGYQALAVHPSAEEKARKAFDIQLAEKLSQQGDRLVWTAYFDEYTMMPTMELFYRYGKFCIPTIPQGFFFTIWGRELRLIYPGLSPELVGQKVYLNVLRWVDIVVVFEDPSEAVRQFNNDYTRAVSYHVSKTVAEDDRWARIFELDSQPYGKLVGYRNKAIAGTNVFEKILKGQIQLAP